MSIAADFDVAIAALRRCGLHGTSPTSYEMRVLVGCILAHGTASDADALAIYYGSLAIVTGKDAVIAANTAIGVQTAILAGIGGDSATAGAAIDALLVTLMVANGVLTAAGVTLAAAQPIYPSSLVANPVIDGYND